MTMLRKVLVSLSVLMLSVSALPQKDVSDMDKKELAMLGKLTKSYEAAKAKFVAKPKAADTKKVYISSAMALAEAVRVSPALGPKDKYPRSLRLFREVLKTDPGNKTAKARRDEIEEIYRSMGRPIPK